MVISTSQSILKLVPLDSLCYTLHPFPIIATRLSEDHIYTSPPSFILFLARSKQCIPNVLLHTRRIVCRTSHTKHIAGYQQWAFLLDMAWIAVNRDHSALYHFRLFPARMNNVPPCHDTTFSSSASPGGYGGSGVFGIPGFSLVTFSSNYQDGNLGVEPFAVLCVSVVLLRVPFVRKKR